MEKQSECTSVQAPASFPDPLTILPQSHCNQCMNIVQNKQLELMHGFCTSTGRIIMTFIALDIHSLPCVKLSITIDLYLYALRYINGQAGRY